MKGSPPQQNSYGSHVSFQDPDGNTWVMQEITVRLTGDKQGGSLTAIRALQDSLQRAQSAAQSS
jgi:hypothetical protein